MSKTTGLNLKREGLSRDEWEAHIGNQSKVLEKCKDVIQANIIGNIDHQWEGLKSLRSQTHLV
jgi:hypothetical protein